ncbi:MAG: sel1 repeat family protein [Alphaproteobacteria bacterium]|nr:sel1 repeat family protein [Alphaproteobacteria bacterium]
MIKYILAFVLVFATAPVWADDEPSLLDLFGEEEKKEAAENVKPTDSPSQVVKKEEVTEEAKADEDEGVFSFLNFSFLRNKEKAKEFVRKTDEPQETYEERMSRLANDGDIEACLTLGYMYLDGEQGLERDDEKALMYYSMAAEKKDKIALNNLGSLYYNGIGTKKDVVKAAQLFEEAAALGNNEAAVNLAFVYLTNSSFSGDQERAAHRSRVVRLFNQAAEGGNATAQYMMGMIYYNGFGLNKNDDKAFQYLKKAAAQYDEAQYQLALRYMNAEGTPRNYGNAVNNLIRAAKQGHIPSMLWLGDILAAGTSYPKNEYEAYVWYNIASVYDPKNAAERRDKLESKLKIEEVLQAQAAAESYKSEPTEITDYVHRTFGVNLADYVTEKKPSRPRK